MVAQNVNNHLFSIANGVQNVEQQRPVTIILGPFTQRCLAGSANLGHRAHLITQITTRSTIRISPTEAWRRRRTTAAILTGTGTKASGATQWIRTCVGNRVTFPSAKTDRIPLRLRWWQVLLLVGWMCYRPISLWTCERKHFFLTQLVTTDSAMANMYNLGCWQL